MFNTPHYLISGDEMNWETQSDLIAPFLGLEEIYRLSLQDPSYRRALLREVPRNRQQAMDIAFSEDNDDLFDLALRGYPWNLVDLASLALLTRKYNIVGEIAKMQNGPVILIQAEEQNRQQYNLALRTAPIDRRISNIPERILSALEVEDRGITLGELAYEYPEFATTLLGNPNYTRFLPELYKEHGQEGVLEYLSMLDDQGVLLPQSNAFALISNVMERGGTLDASILYRILANPSSRQKLLQLVQAPKSKNKQRDLYSFLVSQIENSTQLDEQYIDNIAVDLVSSLLDRKGRTRLQRVLEYLPFIQPSLR